MRRLAAGLLLWILFFLISVGLGYSGLNRYDPRKQLPDAAVYARLAAAGPQAIESHFRFRILVPFLARTLNRVVQGHTGSWNPLMFSFLVVNASFVATTAYLTVKIGSAHLASYPLALFGAALYLLNFAITNLQLAALVDSAEACLLMAIVAGMFYGRWALLPFLGFVGSLAKESFIPFSAVMCLGWWIASKNRKEGHALLWIAGMVAVEILTILVLQSVISGRTIWPWDFALALNSPTSFGTNLLHSIVDRNSWYVLVWLAPLGLAAIKQFPQEWIAAAGAGTLTAIVLNAYHSTVGGGGGGIGRYIFDVAGPLLSLAAAAFLSRYLSENQPSAALD